MLRKYAHIWLLILITLAGLGLRLLAWRWHEFRPLGGDEREYLDLAIHLAQGNGYYDLQFMRPPLFPIGMAVFVWLFDGDLQLLRLINVLISTATIPLMYLWARVLLPQQSRRMALVAAGLTAAHYTLALNATELLTETITLAGLTIIFMLLTLAVRQHRWRWILGAGVAIALVCLIRSVALPLLGLGTLLLWFNHADGRRKRHAVGFVLAGLLTIMPWTMRNAIQYGGFILVDTTGQENLWLDNDPRGREAVKAELYALGDQRVQRATLASQRGIASISQNMNWFAQKSWNELQKFWSLEHSDDMLTRRAIWQPAIETWLRLILGDGLWLVILLAGTVGIMVMPIERGLRWMLLIWLIYTVFTAVLFHVELRYRLPLLPVLIIGAAYGLGGKNAESRAESSMVRQAHQPQKLESGKQTSAPLLLRVSALNKHVFWAIAVAGVLLGFTLNAGDYLRTAPRLAYKHWLLWQAEASMNDPHSLPTTGILTNDTDIPLFQAQARAAKVLQLDPDSALARVLLARVALRLGDMTVADEQLLAAIAALPAHPYAHLLRGDLLRSQGDVKQAAREFEYESASTENMQRWARLRLSQTPLTTTLTIGFNDMGFIEGFYLPEERSRWFGDQARVWLAAPDQAQTLMLDIAAQRPDGIPSPELTITINGVPAGSFKVGNDWQTISVRLPDQLDRSQPLRIELSSSTTFVPHDVEQTNPDGRKLGVRVRLITLR